MPRRSHLRYLLRSGILGYSAAVAAREPFSMMKNREVNTCFLFVLAILLSLPGAIAQPPTARFAPDRFETKIRPLLHGECSNCHGPTLQRGSLRFDQPLPMRPSERESVITRIRRAVSYKPGTKQMPPTHQLAPELRADLLAWLDADAPFPKKVVPVRSKPLWSLEPVSTSEKRNVSETESQVIDRLVLIKLKAAKLSPAPKADAYTRIRRASFDLTGLPPTQADITAFQADKSPRAFDHAVERLLKSPSYGTHWARKWLDLARYADTKGYVYDEERRFAFAYTFRDWVINALNDDMPYNDFLRLQIAADRYPDTSKENLAALGFLTVGRRFVNNLPDVLDDRIDVIMRTTQGLTVACARCHDHKFDPISTKDYYGIYGILAQSNDNSVPMSPLQGTKEEQQTYISKHDAAVAAFQVALDKQRLILSSRLRSQILQYMTAVPDVSTLPGPDFLFIVSKEDTNPFLVRKFKAQIDQANSLHSRVFKLWQAFGTGSDDRVKLQAQPVIQRLRTDAAYAATYNPIVVSLFTSTNDIPKLGSDIGKKYGKLLSEINTEWLSLLTKAKDNNLPQPVQFTDPNKEELRQVLYADSAVTSVPFVGMNELEWLFDNTTRGELNKLKMVIDTLDVESPATPQHAMSLQELPRVAPQRIYRRGDPRLPGDPAPNAFLSAIASCKFQTDPSLPTGRRNLAESIISPKNPLTARVMVNRVWAILFSNGIVTTTSDFGTRGSAPSNPHLLDYLACEFIKHKWSIKWLIGTITKTNTYQQSTITSQKDRIKDPENLTFSRMSRKRLTFEQLRDTLLSVSNLLDQSSGGKSVDLFPQTPTARRTIYATMDRQFVNATFLAFDFSNPDQHTAKRHETTTAQQALFLLNHPFAYGIAKKLAENTRAPGNTAPITRLYQAVLQRQPTPNELHIAQKLGVQTMSPDPLAWAEFCHALIMTNNVLFVE